MRLFARIAEVLRPRRRGVRGAARDLEKMLDQVITEMSDDLVLAKNQVRLSVERERRLSEMSARDRPHARELDEARRALRREVEALRCLSELVEETKRERLRLELRAQTARRQSQVFGALGDPETSSIRDLIAGIEARVRRMEADAEVAAELSSGRPARNDGPAGGQPEGSPERMKR
jgi:phage shock protein A